MPRWPMFVNLATAVLCLLFSAIYHQFGYQSLKMQQKLQTLDYGGICFLIMGSTYPPMFYPYACEPLFGMRNMFMIVSTVSNTSMFFSLFHPVLGGSEGRAFRGFGFVFLGLSAAAPLVYLRYQADAAYMSYFSVWAYLLGGFVYIGGAIIYVLRIPERCYPTKFDIIGASHQIFHICVIVGAYIHFQAGLQLYERRAEFVCPVELPSF